MKAFHIIEEGKHYWICSACLGDHSRILKAQNCCMNQTMPDLDMTVGRQPNKPLTERGMDYITKPKPESLYGRR